MSKVGEWRKVEGESVKVIYRYNGGVLDVKVWKDIGEEVMVFEGKLGFSGVEVKEDDDE